jgi:hypothetical protein
MKSYGVINEISEVQGNFLLKNPNSNFSLYGLFL